MFIDTKFGRLTAIKEASRINGRRAFECVCDCGNMTVVRLDALLNGNTKSCGCMKGRRRTHDLVGTPEYRAWSKMKSRCLNENTVGYEYYGGKGIGVCDRWMRFEAFYSDMGQRPGDDYFLQREDMAMGYDPENCKWGKRR